MVKILLKFALCVVVYSVVFIIGNALMPYSLVFKELGPSENPFAMLFSLINNAWVCFTVFFIVRHANAGGTKLFIKLLAVIFSIQYLMTQIETLLFINGFPSLTIPDVFVIMLSGLLPLLAVIPLSIRFFGNKNPGIYPIIDSADKPADQAPNADKSNIKTVLLKLAIIGAIYCCIYLIFGFLIAFRFDEVRIFYLGTSQLATGQRAHNFDIPLWLVQIIRGVLFGALIIPLKSLLNNKKEFVISVCLVYLTTAIMLITPNKLMPDIVRIAHLIEMTSSMLLFGIIAGNIIWWRTGSRGKKKFISA